MNEMPKNVDPADTQGWRVRGGGGGFKARTATAGRLTTNKASCAAIKAHPPTYTHTHTPKHKART